MSLMDLFLNEPSAADKMLAVLSQMNPTSRGTGSGGVTGIATGDALMPGDPALVSRRGVTLQNPAMQSLLDIARQSKLMPGTRELRYIDESYRTPGQQAAAYAAKPGVAAPPGSSYHQQGLAVDASWWSDHLANLLQQAGWNRFDPSGEPWHWSYQVTG